MIPVDALTAGRSVLITGGAASGKTHMLAELIEALVPSVYHAREVVGLAVTRGSQAALQEATDLVSVSTVQSAAYWGSTSPGRTMVGHQGAFEHGYLNLIRQAEKVGDTYADRKFMRGARQQLTAALRLEARARYAGEDLMSYAGPDTPAAGFLMEVADRYADYKQERGLADEIDLLLSARPDPRVRLVVVDDAEDLSRFDLDLIRKLYPAAAWLAAGNPGLAIRTWAELVPIGELPHEEEVDLDGSPAEVERWAIDSSAPYPSLVPPDVDDAPLIILGSRDRYAFRRWIHWCMEAGRPFRLDDSPVLDKQEVRDVAALWACDQGEEVHPVRLDQLARALGEPEGCNICAADFPQWSSWREMAILGGYPQGAVAYAELLLDRYGTLDLAEIGEQPMPRITSVARCKGLRAEVVIIDGFSMRPVHGEAPDITKARWTLASSRARRKLIVLQSETNPKQRQPS